MVLVVTGAIALIWLTTTLTVGLVFATTDPQTALKWWPWSADAQAMAASELLDGEPTPVTLAKARTLAVSALDRKPTSVIASRILGLVYSIGGSKAGSARMFDYAERLSRRDVPTQLWLIEASVERGDIDGALRHYDRAMRVSPEIWPVIGPILAKAADDGQVARKLGRLMAGRPVWWPDIFRRLTTTANVAGSFETVVREMKFDLNNRLDVEYVGFAFERLANLGAADAAFAIYADLSGKSHRSSAIRAGDFERVGNVRPFDWQLSDTADHFAVVEHRQASTGNALSIFTNGTAGRVASQLLTLPTGRYSFSGRVGDVAEDMLSPPTLTMVCAGPQPVVLTTFSLPRTKGGVATFNEPFDVPPSDCAGQWLLVDGGASIDRPETSPWVDDLSIERVAR